jgi:nucleoside-diphosphate-sugar epimerase
VAVTGASGYLGSRIGARFAAAGWRVLRLVRTPQPGAEDERAYQLAGPCPPGLLDSVDALVHAAYDLRLTRREDIWRVNVEGTRRLLAAATAEGVGRVVVLSSMSAYPGTRQLYGQAKLAIEEAALATGAVVLRPGLVYGADPGGTAGALRRLTRLPLLPLISPDAVQFPVHEDEVGAAVVAAATVERAPAGPVGVAAPAAVPFSRVLEMLAAAEGRRCRFLPIPVPWQLALGAIRAAELLRLPLPFRSDSILGLVRPAASVPGAEELSRLGVQIGGFGWTTAPDPR